MTDTEREILKAAVRLEEDGREFYMNLAAKAATEPVKKIFESLAADENKHIEWLEELTPESIDAGEVNRDIYMRLRGIFDDAPQEMRETAAASENDIAALRLGLDMEERSEEAYRKWADESGEGPARELCVLIAGAEAFHRQLIQNMIEYLDRTIDWFMMEERWSFDGG